MSLTPKKTIIIVFQGWLVVRAIESTLLRAIAHIHDGVALYAIYDSSPVNRCWNSAFAYIASCWAITFTTSKGMAFLTGCQQVRNPSQMETLHVQAFPQMSRHYCGNALNEWVSFRTIACESRSSLWAVISLITISVSYPDREESNTSSRLHVFTSSRLHVFTSSRVHTFAELLILTDRLALASLLHCSIAIYCLSFAVNFLWAVLLFHQ
jgi:hypothetical protein